MKKKTAPAKTHECPICGHQIPLSTTGNFKSHGPTGELRRHRGQQVPYCPGTVLRVRNGVVIGIDHKPYKPEPKTGG